MTEPVPDFFISSEEHQFMLEGRACFVLGRIRGVAEGGLVWIKVLPPLFPEDSESSEVLIAPRLKGLDLDQMTTRDVPVYILRIVNRDAVLSGSVEPADVKLQWWGEVARERRLLPKIRY